MMAQPNTPDLWSEHLRIRAEATRLTGRSSDLGQRASMYFQLYQHSNGNHAFPLLAAHGALWEAGHFAKGLRLGRFAALALPKRDNIRAQKLASLDGFARAFQEINRKVFVETYVCYHLTYLHGDHRRIRKFIPNTLLEPLNDCHRATRQGRTLDAASKKHLFEAFFMWQQEHIVTPGVDAAIAAMDWPLMQRLALKPVIGLRYFAASKRLWFKDYGNKPERIQKGLQTFDLAQQAGWGHVARALGSCQLRREKTQSTSAGRFEAIIRVPPRLSENRAR